MSLKDDFLEALRSVKKDFFKDYDAQPAQAGDQAPGAAAEPIQVNGQPMSNEELGALLRGGAAAAEDGGPEVHTPYAEAPANRMADEDAPRGNEEFADLLSGGGPPQADGRVVFDDPENEGDTEGYTIISKNTVIRGALQTEDSMRMFGQILGDIDCKSNILVAGKVRGNTSAANAYIVNAQVDGNLLCDDVINVTDDAWILGNIRAQEADIDGKIKGNIEIRHAISIGSNSSVIGNISTDELEIKRGAFINGQVMMYSPSRDVIDRFDSFDQ